MKVDSRILSVFAFGLLVGTPALACNQHPPDVSHERWLAQIQTWNKEYDAKQAAKAQAAQTEKREATAGRERGRRNADDPAPMGRRGGGEDPQVRSVGRQPQSLPAAVVAAPAAPTSPNDDRRARRYR